MKEITYVLMSISFLFGIMLGYYLIDTIQILYAYGYSIFIYCVLQNQSKRKYGMESILILIFLLLMFQIPALFSQIGILFQLLFICFLCFVIKNSFFKDIEQTLFIKTLTYLFLILPGMIIGNLIYSRELFDIIYFSLSEMSFIR